MKTKVMIMIMVVCFLFLSSINAQVVDFQWNTFMGSGDHDSGYAVALDSSGNIYVTGYGYTTWGSPVNAHSGGADVIVACLDSSGNMLWNTFLGSDQNDKGYGIALDGSGNVYVTGYSFLTWGSPVNPFNTGWDVFVAKLDTSGNLLWNTFLGSDDSEYGYGIAVDGSGNVYVTGKSFATWGSPVNGHSGSSEIFVARLDSSGNLSWNTFAGSAGDDCGNSIVLDSSGNSYLTGWSDSTWGSPINAHSGSLNAFVTCLDSSGNRLWNTFMGSNDDNGMGIALDGKDYIYVTGSSYDSWGSPVNAHSGGYDVFTACLDNSGNRLWNTFLGSSGSDVGYGIALDGSGNINVTGHSNASWGTPVQAHSGDWDAFLVVLADSGNLLCNTFLGSTSTDYGHGIVLDDSGHSFITGLSSTTWGSPVNSYSGGGDVFVAKLFSPPFPDIIANGSEGPISINESDTLQIRVSLNRFGSGENVDYWLAYHHDLSGWVHYNKTTKKWEPGLGVTHQGPLFDINNKKVFQKSGLAPGNYAFYFGVDMNMNGKLTKMSLYYDEVNVTVTQ